MKLKLLVISFLLMGIISCKKTGGGNPQIKIKSIGPSVVSRSDLFTVDLSFTNLSGSSSDSLVMIKHVLNLNQRGTVNEFQADSFAIPSFTSSNNAGDLQLTFARVLNSYPYLPDPQTSQNDTATFSFVVVGAPNIVSDTARSGTIVILSQ